MGAPRPSRNPIVSAMEKTGPRVALFLMCGLAICCSVMYITSDGADVQETILASKEAAAKSVYGIGGSTSVNSDDVEKAGTIFTNTPDGRMRLTDYLTNVEKEIAAEAAARKRDVAAAKAQMDRNFAFNKAARAKLQKALLKRMAANAKIAKDNLATAMRHVQAQFAKAAALSNKRNAANIKRSKKLRKVIARNKRIADKNLAHAVSVQQHAMEALSQKMNARIAQTNKHVAQNAANIKKNAKIAHDALTHAMSKYDQKLANARAEAAAGRSKLAAQLAAQDKSLRAWAGSRMKVVMAKTAAQFARVRAKMAADRENADRALKAASSRMTASLDAEKALRNKQFAKTVKDIQAAKDEAKAKVAAAKTQFKTSLFKLTATVNEQVKKTNQKIDALANTVQKNKVAQAKVNANVNAEMKRMVALGNKRYNEHLKKDKELHSLIKANKAATDKRMEAMGAHYMMELNAVRSTMKKNRAHASHMLAKKSAALYSAIEKDQRSQMKINGQLAAQTRAAKLDIDNALREAKSDFSKRIGALSKTVAKNDKKFEGKMDKLTRIVRANAQKNAQGRAELKSMMDANKKEMHAAVNGAIEKGKKRMAAAEQKLTDLNKKTKAALSLKITTEIAKLEKRANDQIEGLHLQSKEARAEMRKEMLFAIRSMASEAKKNLAAAKDSAMTAFTKAEGEQAAAASKSAAGRAKIAGEIAQAKENAAEELQGAVATMNRALISLKFQTMAKIKKTNTDVSAYADELKKEAIDVGKIMDNQMNTLNGAIKAQVAKTKAGLAGANAASVAGFAKAGKAVEAALAAALKRSNDKFVKLDTDMAQQRSDLDKSLAGAVDNMNDSIAKQAALADSRFEKTVKDIKAARKEASAQVSLARKTFATQLIAATASIKDMETKLNGDIQKVSGQVMDNKSAQAKVNRSVKAELTRIAKLMNHRKTVSKRARGKLLAILDENKRAAAEEVKALDGLFKTKLSKIRSQAADDAIEAKQDLTDATEEMTLALETAQREQLYANQVSAQKINKYSVDAQAKIAAAKKNFQSRLTVLSNTVAANHKKVKGGFEVLSGVVQNYKQVGKAERALLRQQNDALNADMNKAIVRAIDEGEARANGIAIAARGHLARAKQTLLVEISDKVENMADMAFKTIQGGHQKTADNYLSLKAYAVTAKDKITDYVAEGKGKNLSSLGTVLTEVAGMAKVHPGKAEGLSATKTLPAVFGGDKITVDNTVSKINGLVNEYITMANMVRKQYSMGLGKYLLEKLEASMQGKGALQVDKVSDKSGNFVFINGHAVGLSNKLNDFEGLAVRMGHYEATLAKLTAALSGKVHKAIKKKMEYAKPPEWSGD